MVILDVNITSVTNTHANKKQTYYLLEGSLGNAMYGAWFSSLQCLCCAKHERGIALTQDGVYKHAEGMQKDLEQYQYDIVKR